MDLSGMSAADLRALQEKLARELKNRSNEEIANAREQIQAIADGIGMSVKDVMATQVKVKLKETAIRFRHPDNGSLKWSGLGRKPNWVKEWESSKSIEDLRI